MRTSSSDRAIVIAFLVLLSFTSSVVATAATSNPPGEKPNSPATAEASLLVQQALAAEADGQSDTREALLKQAVQAAPDFAPAHWHSGEVQVGGKWTSIDNASARKAQNAKLEEYRQRRDALLEKIEALQATNRRPSADDQLELARWCEKAGLPDQQRLHLLAALQLQPNLAEAKNKLGLVRWRGTLVPGGQVKDLEEQLKEDNENFAKWKERLQKLSKQIEKGQDAEAAIDQIRKINDAAAIPALEAMFGRSKPEVGLAVVECLSNLPDLAAVESLVRFSVLSPHSAVREAAANALKPRSMYAYVPLLISGLKSPVVVQFQRFILPNGGAGFQMSMFQENPAGDKVYNSGGMMDTTFNPSATSREQAMLNATTPRGWKPGQVQLHSDPVGAMKPVAAAAARAEQKANDALAGNEEIAASNGRIIEVLRTATGDDRGSDAMAWWNWWLDYNEYDKVEKGPTQYSSDYKYTSPYSVSYTAPTAPAPPPPPPGTHHSCFVAGTPVLAATGPMQIEKIKPGDFVLSQDPETGELAYKAVLSTTAGPPLPLMNVQVGERLLRCTLGHPFWVSGAGWKMAKELKPGDRLHTVSGTVVLDNAERRDEERCYNLVVADFNTYFVGEAKLLVHDITLRDPTDKIVPGLLK